MDDIRSIVDAAQDIGKDGKLKISIGGYEFSSIEELSQLKQKEHDSIQMSYQTSSPYSSFEVSVRNRYSSVSFYPSSENRLIAKGAFASVEKLILSKRRKWQWVDTFFYASTGLLTGVSLLLLQGKVYKDLFATYLGLGIGIIWILGLILFVSTAPLRKSKIVIVDKADHSSFWNRNKDQILITVISSIVTFILGVISGYFLK